MLDIAWTEMLVILVLLIVVVGPKDLPKVMRVVGQLTRKARGMAREFRGGLDDMMRESELEELRQQAAELRRLNPNSIAKKAIDPDEEIKAGLDLPSKPLAPSAKPSAGSGQTEQGSTASQTSPSDTGSNKTAREPGQ